MASSKRKRRLVVTGVVLAGYVASTIVAIKQGYSFGRNVPVRCRQGHLYTTMWIPGASLKALRLGLWRFQWCPVGRHFDLVRLVKESGLSPAELELAAEHHDIPIP